ncbi:MAG: chemotaxis protein CheD [Clostridia bacterium]|nr:chemotaxis protein CheD [Clostridia bacterium]
MERIIGIGEYAITNDTNDKIKTYALGSCVALTVYCPIKKVLGMAHIALPKSDIQPEKRRAQPGYFADTAVLLLLDKICLEYGCKKETLVIKLFGGANSIRPADLFKIGIKNVKAVKKLLAEHNLKCLVEDTGGTVSRTVEADAETGEVSVETQPLFI